MRQIQALAHIIHNSDFARNHKYFVDSWFRSWKCDVASRCEWVVGKRTTKKKRHWLVCYQFKISFAKIYSKLVSNSRTPASGEILFNHYPILGGLAVPAAVFSRGFIFWLPLRWLNQCLGVCRCACIASTCATLERQFGEEDAVPEMHRIWGRQSWSP